MRSLFLALFAIHSVSLVAFLCVWGGCCYYYRHQDRPPHTWPLPTKYPWI